MKIFSAPPMLWAIVAYKGNRACLEIRFITL